jgi:RNA polymerase sigma factor (sigma-70 family)
MDTEDLTTLVHRARGGDAAAWDTIVDEYTPLLWSVVRGFRLSDAACADAVQATWLLLLEHIDQVREPARLAGWLRTTARRACLETLRGGSREVVVDLTLAPQAATSFLHHTEWGTPDVDVVRREQVSLLRMAIASLPHSQRALLDLLTATPALSYQQVSERLGIPIGSIGPTRGRILSRLRTQLETAGLRDAVPA